LIRDELMIGWSCTCLHARRRYLTQVTTGRCRVLASTIQFGRQGKERGSIGHQVSLVPSYLSRNLFLFTFPPLPCSHAPYSPSFTRYSISVLTLLARSLAPRPRKLANARQIREILPHLQHRCPYQNPQGRR
jgi:hypothetical protein